MLLLAEGCDLDLTNWPTVIAAVAFFAMCAFICWVWLR